MDVITVLCPKCGKGLKIRDKGLLGKTGKCPSCEHRFVLEESAEAEVQLELADRDVPRGTSAKWVPDDPMLGGRHIGSGRVGGAAVRSVPPLAEEQGFGVAALPDEGPSRFQEIRRKNRRRRTVAILMGAITAAVLGGGYFLVAPILKTAPPRSQKGGAGVATAAGGATEAARAASRRAASSITQAEFDANAKLIEDVRPTHGKPIQLLMMPGGVNVVIHLRPAQLWSNELQLQELRATMTEGLVNWIAAKLKEICRREPQQIDEALIGLMLGARGTDPELAAVVRLKDDAKLSDLIEEFRGQQIGPEGGPRLFRSPPYAYLIHDAKTIAICPAAMGAELADWITTPNFNTTEGIFQLLKETDRDRMFTALFEVDDVRRHEEWLFPESTRPAFVLALDAISEDAETVCWSLHVGQNLHSDLIFRTRVAGASGKALTSPAGLAQIMLDKLEQLPHDMVEAVRKMRPQRKGFQQVIGRYPAMLEAFRMASLPTKGERFARVTTVLPDKAAPNLMLGTMLAWDESTRTDFSASAPQPTIAAAGRADLPATVAERLKLEVDAEFNRTPLQEALGYICAEIKVNLDIDGDALKDAGYTQNIPQTFNLGRVPASMALQEILKPNTGGPVPENQMVVCIDEEKKLLMVLTEKFANQRGLKIHLAARRQ